MEKRIAPWFAALVAWLDNLGDLLFGSWLNNIRDLSRDD